MTAPQGPAVVADTHALLWYLADPELLSPMAREVLEGAADTDRRILISPVTLIELVYLAEKRSDSIDRETLRDVLAAMDAADSPIEVKPVTTEVARRMALVDRRHVRDPFDRAIVATAQVATAQLVTRDRLLTEHFADLCVW